jgi:uncharacterized membrane protein YdjX (TVP38/TMEM64 family)
MKNKDRGKDSGFVARQWQRLTDRLKGKKLTTQQWIWIGVLAVIVAGFVVLYYVGLNLGWFKFLESRDTMRAWVRGFGAWAPLAFFLLQFIQVIFSPIPGNLTTIVGGMLFGFVYGFLLSLAAIFLGSVVAFLLGKSFGRPLVERIAGKALVEKYMKSVSSRQRVVLIMMFLLPFFPDDLLCLIAGLSAMRLPQFSRITILTRPWGLLFSALAGAGLLKIPTWGWAVIGIAAIALFVLSLKYAPAIEERTHHLIDKIESKLSRKSN